MNKPSYTISSILSSILILAGCGGNADLAPATQNTPTLTVSIDDTNTLVLPTQAPSPTLMSLPAPSELPYPSSDIAVPEGALARIGMGNVVDVQVFPDGERAIIAATTGLYAYQLPTFDLIWRQIAEAALESISLSPDGSRLVTNHGWDEPPRLYDAQTGKLLATLDGWRDVSWSPDSKRIAAAVWPNSCEKRNDTLHACDIPIHIYDGSTGDLQRTFVVPEVELVWVLSIGDLTWSSNGKYLAACADRFVNNAFSLWNVEAEAENSLNYPYSCTHAFNPENTQLALHAEEGIQIVDLETMEVIGKLEGDHNLLEWTPSGLLARNSTYVEHYDGTKWHNIAPVTKDQELSVSPSGDRMAVLSPENNQITVYDIASHTSLYTIGIPFFFEVDASYELSWSQNERWLAYDTFDPDFHGPNRDEDRLDTYTVFDAATGTHLFSYRDIHPIFAGENMALDYDVYQLLHDAPSRRVVLLDLPSGDILNGFTTNAGMYKDYGDTGRDVDDLETDIRWFTDSRTLMIGDQLFWSEDAGGLLLSSPRNVDGLTLQESPSTFTTPYWQPFEGFSPDNALHVAIGSFGKAPGLYESYEIHEPYLLTEAYVQMYDNATGQQLYQVNVEGKGIYSGAWSADGDMLALSTSSVMYGSLSDYQIIILNAWTGKQIKVLEGHLGPAEMMAFSPDGSRLVSHSWDKSVIVWDLSQ